MTILDWLLASMQILREAGVDSPRRDALVLLEDELDKDRSWVIAHPEFELSTKTLSRLDLLIKKRQKRKPLAYIRGKAWFYGRFFTVNDKVMIPRPESEDIIDILKKLKPKQIIDIGTGSGCLAITAKLEMPNTAVSAVDISNEALQVANINAKNHKVDINFIQGSLLDKIKVSINKKVTIIANLPYVPNDLITSPEINFEPKIALFSGKDGLNHYQDFWQQVSDLKNKPRCIVTESLESQHDEISKMAKPNYRLLEKSLLIQVFELT